MLLCLGVVGGVLGIVVGQRLAVGLLANALPPEVQLPAMTLDVWLLLKAATSALGVCILGSWWVVRSSQLPLVMSLAIAVGLATLLL